MLGVPSFPIGTSVRATATITNFVGVPTNPTALVLKIRDPKGVVVTPTLTNVSTGLYYGDFLTTARPGTWQYRWEATGTVTRAQEGKFLVEASDFVKNT